MGRQLLRSHPACRAWYGGAKSESQTRTYRRYQSVVDRFRSQITRGVREELYEVVLIYDNQFLFRPLNDTEEVQQRVLPIRIVGT